MEANWINALEQSPPEDGIYLVYDEKEGVVPSRYVPTVDGTLLLYKSYSPWWGLQVEGDDATELLGVTHWMPLPAPPAPNATGVEMVEIPDGVFTVSVGMDMENNEIMVYNSVNRDPSRLDLKVLLEGIASLIIIQAGKEGADEMRLLKEAVEYLAQPFQAQRPTIISPEDLRSIQ